MDRPLYREAFWLVSDRLGTPRMIVSKSGSLASVKRHDYLPFGEEVYAGIGGRTTTQGYTGDSTRQHFTGYEADAETGLNFAEARYQSPGQGRFTSVDPLGASASVGDPQSFNRYSYVNNNPTNLNDPSGMMTGADASQSWGDVSGTFWGEAFDFNASHFGGPAIIANGMDYFADRVDHGSGSTPYAGNGTMDPGEQPEDETPANPEDSIAYVDLMDGGLGGGWNTQTQTVPCAINVNVSGASGQILSDAEDEITRIFQSGGMPIKVVFNSPDKPQPGAFNLVIVPGFTGEAAAAIKRQARGVDASSILGVTPTMGKSVYVNQTGISAAKSKAGRESSASLGTMIGRVGAHELIWHRLLGNLREGTMNDISSSRGVGAKELRAAFTTRFNLNPLNAAMLSKLCRP